MRRRRRRMYKQKTCVSLIKRNATPVYFSLLWGSTLIEKKKRRVEKERGITFRRDVESRTFSITRKKKGECCVLHLFFSPPPEKKKKREKTSKSRRRSSVVWWTREKRKRRALAPPLLLIQAHLCLGNMIGIHYIGSVNKQANKQKTTVRDVIKKKKKLNLTPLDTSRSQYLYLRFRISRTSHELISPNTTSTTNEDNELRQQATNICRPSQRKRKRE